MSSPLNSFPFLHATPPSTRLSFCVYLSRTVISSELALSHLRIRTLSASLHRSLSTSYSPQVSAFDCSACLAVISSSHSVPICREISEPTVCSLVAPASQQHQQQSLSLQAKRYVLFSLAVCALTVHLCSQSDGDTGVPSCEISFGADGLPNVAMSVKYKSDSGSSTHSNSPTAAARAAGNYISD